MRRLAVIAALAVLVPSSPGMAAPPDALGVDRPELAGRGPYAVGVRRESVVIREAPAVLSGPASAAPGPRILSVTVWYPARGPADSQGLVYEGTLPSDVPGRTVPFRLDAGAAKDAPAEGRERRPLVILSHGFSGSPELLSWLGENLASKGYVVAAPAHQDPPLTDPTGFGAPLLFRPLDIAGVAHELQARARAGADDLAREIDPDRVALVGYSMGGYGVLTVAGAGLSAAAARASPGGALAPYRPGGPDAQRLTIHGLKAVAAISPAGGSPAFPAWGGDGLAGLRLPLFLIVGDMDKVVGYAPGVMSIFEGAINAPRRLLVFENAGHSIGMGKAPATMTGRLWDQDWFEDPVWRKERTIGVNLHFLTAFLDAEVKGDKDHAAFLNVSGRSNDGVWTRRGQDTAYDLYSPGGAVTVWKGFQMTHAAGLRMTAASAADGRAPP